MDGRILALMSALCFGINPIVIKAGVKNANANLAVLIGLLTGLPLLILMSTFLGGVQFDQLNAAAVIYFALGGLFGIVLGRGALYRSIKDIGSTRASVFKNGAPVVTAILAPIFLAEVVAWQRWAGILLVTFGLTLVGGMVRRLDLGSVRAAALGVALLAPLFYGIRPIFSKLGLNQASLPLAATLIGYIAATLVYLVLFVINRQQWWGQIGWRETGLFAAAGALQVFGLLLLNYALQRSEVSRIYPISASAPLVTFLLTVTVLRNVEQLGWMDLLGTLLVISGVIWLLS